MNPARRKVEDEGACRVCLTGPARVLEAAHLWPRSRGATGFDSPDIIVPLCKPVGLGGSGCHDRFDAHRLDLLHLLTLDEQLALVAAAGGIEQARIRACPSSYLNPDTRSDYP